MVVKISLKCRNICQMLLVIEQYLLTFRLGGNHTLMEQIVSLLLFLNIF